LLRTTASSRIFTLSASKNTTECIASSGRDCHAATSFITASVTLLMRSGDTSTEMHFGQKAMYLAHRHAARVHDDDLVVKAREAPLVLADQLRLEAGMPVARHFDVQRPGVGQHRLGAPAVAVVRRARRLGLAAL
jgi:hypothetical protein